MKALSIQQPWAWAILHVGKDIENRTWKTNFRGDFLIHAGKKEDPAGYDLLELMGVEVPESLPLGGIVGKATIIDCIEYPGNQVNNPWFFGPFGFVLASRQILDFMPLRGQLGFFEADYPGVTK